ncbi:hypothetical protein [Metallibacterium scheffleri]|uniref:hypothetical protein n=1 Tax=Metallibacterium scheffleri TaxID=993689 RepID=UPI001118E93F|nr:hypothetical protein [Metallibacterium scheffleri]
MLAALDNGVKGGKWFSLMDKVMRPATLQAAWGRVVRNCGAAGVDRQSVDAFAAGVSGFLCVRRFCFCADRAVVRAVPA